MRRSSLKRKTPLTAVGKLARSAMRRGKEMRRRNVARAAKRHALCFGPQAELCRSSPCVACGWVGASDPHHEPPRSRGGVDQDTVALCRRCHEMRHTLGRAAFEMRTGIDLSSCVRAMRAKRGKQCEEGGT